MYIDIPANDNLPEPCMATFTVTGPGLPLMAAQLWNEDHWEWCAVTGWSESGPVPAQVFPIEESGDGPARLIVGGDYGLRLARCPEGQSAPAWDLSASDQWAEPFLICTPALTYR